MDRGVTGRAAVTSLSREGRVSVCTLQRGPEVRAGSPEVHRHPLRASRPLGCLPKGSLSQRPKCPLPSPTTHVPMPS